ncbi:MAG: 3-oxoacyl-[acyl-carrier-protein] synthase III C-terminal domain-containing protein [Acidobacteriota bacterium]
MTQPTVGLQALAISAPDQPENVVTNDYWRTHFPELVERAEEKIWMWKKPKDWSEGSEIFNRTMAPFVLDPFRGARERRRLPKGGTALSLEVDAAEKALAARGLEIGDIDLILCTSFLPDSVGIGGATFLAQALGHDGAAWNLESACSSGTIGFMTACGLIQAGQYKRVLVMTSCVYSRVAQDDDPISWGVGDSAIAMIVGEVEADGAYLGGHTVHSAATCGAVSYTIDEDAEGEPYFRLTMGKQGARLLRETSEPYLKTCTHGALGQAGLEVNDLDFIAVNTPLAWYATFCCKVLGLPTDRTLSVYPLYANVGPALMGLNLFHAAAWGLIERGQKVLLYSVGSVSSCAAVVMEWGDVALGPVPAGASLEHLRAIEAQTLVDAERQRQAIEERHELDEQVA